MLQLLPREKILKYSIASLEITELIALLLRTGDKKNPVMKLAEKIEEKIKLGKTDMNSLTSIEGISLAKASTILAALELGKRIHTSGKSSIPSIQAPADALPLLTDIRMQKKEYFIALYLNARNQLIHKEVISIGTLNGSLVHPREVFEPAVNQLAAQIVIAHNHPSGDECPSDADISVTNRLVEAGKILGIEILDHIIVTATSYYSFKERCKI